MADPTIPAPITLTSSDTLVNREVFGVLVDFYLKAHHAEERWALTNNERFAEVMGAHLVVSRTIPAFDLFIKAQLRG